MANLSPVLIEWGIAARAIPCQQESGDLHLVRSGQDEALVAVADGLGHGAAAANAAAAAMRTLEMCDGESPIVMIQRCHETLRSTRGVVMSMAWFQGKDDTMTWLGVGNVEGFLLHRDARGMSANEALLLRGGVIGGCLPRLSASVVQVGYGDVLILATDGIRPEFADNVNLEDSPQQIANRILFQYGRDTDDALVLVVRYLHGKGSATARQIRG